MGSEFAEGRKGSCRCGLPGREVESRTPPAQMPRRCCWRTSLKNRTYRHYGIRLKFHGRSFQQICFNVEGVVEKTGLERQGLLVVMTGSWWSELVVELRLDLRRFDNRFSETLNFSFARFSGENSIEVHDEAQ